MSGKTLLLYCNKCGTDTIHNLFVDKVEHTIIPEVIDFRNLEFWEDIYVEVYRCGGCSEFVFKKYRIWSEDVPDWPELDVVLLPKRSKLSKDTVQIFQNIPLSIVELYKEVIECFNCEAYYLCAGGLRAIIEAICIDKNIKGGMVEGKFETTLRGKIFGLNEAEYLIKRNSEILLQHKYIGDKALHQLRKPAEDELKIAIEIIAHTLVSIYGLDDNGNKLKGYTKKP